MRRMIILIACSLTLLADRVPTKYIEKDIKQNTDSFNAKLGTRQEAEQDLGLLVVATDDGGRKTCGHAVPHNRSTSRGRDGYTVSDTTAQVDRHGNIYATSTTTEVPPEAPSGYYIYTRVVFYYDAHGVAYRWERQLSFHDDPEASDWRVTEAWELVVDKHGHPMPTNVVKFKGDKWERYP